MTNNELYNKSVKIYQDNNIKDDKIYVISDNKKYNNYYNDEWTKADSIYTQDLEKLLDMVKKQNEDTTTIGTLKVRDNKLIIEHNHSEVILCDLDSENAASEILAGIAKIQLKEINNG